MGIIDIDTAMQMLYDAAGKAPYNPARWTTGRTFVPMDFGVQKKEFVPDPVINGRRKFVKDTTLDNK
jgi:hypothetical protein